MHLRLIIFGLWLLGVRHVVAQLITDITQVPAYSALPSCAAYVVSKVIDDSTSPECTAGSPPRCFCTNEGLSSEWQAQISTNIINNCITSSRQLASQGATVFADFCSLALQTAASVTNDTPTSQASSPTSQTSQTSSQTSQTDTPTSQSNSSGTPSASSNIQSSETSNSATTNTAAASATTGASSPSQSTPSTTTDATGLSNNAKIGIGVGVGVGVLFLAFAIFLAIKRPWRNRTSVTADFRDAKKNKVSRENMQRMNRYNKRNGDFMQAKGLTPNAEALP